MTLLTKEEKNQSVALNTEIWCRIKSWLGLLIVPNLGASHFILFYPQTNLTPSSLGLQVIMNSKEDVLYKELSESKQNIYDI